MANVNKFGVGQKNSAMNPYTNETVTRAEFVFMSLNDQINFFPTVYDPDHFIYQNTMPVPMEKLLKEYNGRIPASKLGPNAMCSCGSEGVIMLEGPHAGKVICKMVAQTGFHTTSHNIRDKQNASFAKNVELMGDSDIAKTMKTQEQVLDESTE